MDYHTLRLRFVRFWTLVLHGDPLAAALLISDRGRVPAGDLDIDQIRGMEYLVGRGFLQRTGGLKTTSADAIAGCYTTRDNRVWYIDFGQGQALTEWIRQECRRLNRVQATYLVSIEEKGGRACRSATV